jgi:hypothetical protein
MVFRTFFETIWSFAKRQFAKIVKEPTTQNRRAILPGGIWQARMDET